MQLTHQHKTTSEQGSGIACASHRINLIVTSNTPNRRRRAGSPSTISIPSLPPHTTFYTPTRPPCKASVRPIHPPPLTIHIPLTTPRHGTLRPPRPRRPHNGQQTPQQTPPRLTRPQPTIHRRSNRPFRDAVRNLVHDMPTARDHHRTRSPLQRREKENRELLQHTGIQFSNEARGLWRVD